MDPLSFVPGCLGFSEMCIMLMNLGSKIFVISPISAIWKACLFNISPDLFALRLDDVDCLMSIHSDLLQGYTMWPQIKCYPTLSGSFSFHCPYCDHSSLPGK